MINVTGLLFATVYIYTQLGPAALRLHLKGVLSLCQEYKKVETGIRGMHSQLLWHFQLSGKSFASGSETTYGKTYAHNINYLYAWK